MSVTGGNVRPPEMPRPGSFVAAYFKDEDDAKDAIESLREKGISSNQIGVAMRAEDIPKHEDWVSDIRKELGRSEEMPEGGEPLNQTFSGMGIEERAATYFEDKLDDGGLVVGVRCDPSRANEVAKVLENNDGDVARDIGTMTGQTRSRTTGAGTAGQSRHIQLMGEMLRTQKERINRGEVRLRKETVTEHRTVEVPVSREEVVIERTPAHGTAPEGRIGEEKEIRIPVSEERVRVEKEPVVTGEVNVQKREVTGTQKVSGEVRHEELRVEKEGDVERSIEERDEGKKAA